MKHLAYGIIAYLVIGGILMYLFTQSRSYQIKSRDDQNIDDRTIRRISLLLAVVIGILL